MSVGSLDSKPTNTAPVRALYKGRTVRVTEYDKDWITVVLWNDMVTQVNRKMLTFLKG